MVISEHLSAFSQTDFFVFCVPRSGSTVYISNIVTPVTHLPGRAHLRLAKNGDYNTPRVLSSFGQRSFSVSGPDAWNRVSRERRGIAVASI